MAQPQIAALYFDDAGRLIMGFKDRSNDITVWMSSPDMLVACQTPSGTFQLESNGKCGGKTGALPNAKSNAGNSMGIGGGYYFQVNQGAGGHDYNVAYGLTRGGPNQVVATGMDNSFWYEGSVRWFDTTTGKTIRAYSIYNATASPGTFSKSNGLGSITSIFPPSLEVFDCGRVWNDINGNGIQDCNEPGIPNIKIYLFSQDNPTCPISYLYSDKDGRYCFSVLPGKQYSCSINIKETQDKFGKFNVSPILNDPRYEGIDSDGVVVGGNIVSNFQASLYCGYSFLHCHFGIYNPDNCPKNGFTTYGWGVQKIN
ncbi:colossin C [Heterostelium album PN500]|uniref:Colossin C n=1 Tax=Heterostelium pallidum (strain ATCC 26659 / Pp 5 / PN500) TaxID=670386 RepID=D3BNU6_HETP5|nr:colossin C [Heterostelium album PN500]EFA76865.1 colossin C [Heterostelium album PN500]|eukprot:XP_020428997.1 colossin C [Heterostelium album PN500]